MTYPDRVSKDERPESTVENIPDDILRSAIKTATTYGECPECSERQFMVIIPGHNSSHKCRNCEEVMTVVG